MKHVVKYALEMHAPTVVREQTVTQNDAIEFVVTLLKGGEPIDMTGVTPSLAVKRRDGVTTALPGTVSGNTVTFALGSTETAKPGTVYAAVQLYGADGRVSSLPFTFQVKADLTAAGTIPSEKEATLIEVVLQDGPGIIQRAETAAADAERVAVENKTNWLDAVATVAERDTAYPSPKHGDTVRVTGTATVYRYEDGKGWVVTDQYQQSAVDALNQQLAEKADKSEVSGVTEMMKEWRIRMPIGYGRITMPTDFYTLDFTLIRNRDGKVVHDIDIDARYRNNNIEQTIYTDIFTGNNETGDGSSASPFRTPNRAFQAAAASASTNIKIIVNADEILRNEFFLGLDTFAEFVNKNIAVTTKDGKKIPVMNGDSTKRTAYQLVGADVVLPAWTLESGKVYKTTRSNTAYVVDSTYRDKTTGLINKMTPVGSIAECESTPGSYYITATTVYVHTFDSRPADGGLTCVLKLAGNYLMFRLRNSRLFIENFEFFIHDGVTWRGDTTSHFIAHNCDFGETIAKNSLTHLHTGKLYMLNCSTHDSFLDGFNYHYPPGVDNRNCFVFEYDCFGFNNGNEPGGTGNNYTTIHDGASILRVNSDGRESQGVVCADVNGSYSVLIDCEMMDSKLPASNLRSASYQFTTDSGLRPAKAVVINSSGISPNWSVLTDEQKGTEVIFETWREGMHVVKKDTVL